MTPAEAEALLYEAVGTPLGLLVRTNDLVRARASLYAARRRLCDETLGCLQFRALPPNHAEQEEGMELLMIVKGAPTAAPKALPGPVGAASGGLDLSDLDLA